jgi:hypothetical protein
MTALARQGQARTTRNGWGSRAATAWRRWTGTGTGPGHRVAAGVALAGLATVALLMVSLVAGSTDHPATSLRQRNAIAAYAAAIDPLVKAGGRIVVEGVKPGVTDLRTGRMSAADFRARASAWRTDMAQVRQKVSALPHPGTLDDAAALFDVALRRYGDAIDAFVTASDQTPLATAITAAVPVAEDADRIYDRADALVQRALAQVGLPTRPAFPTGP